MQLQAQRARHSAIASVHRTMNERRKNDAPEHFHGSITCECECHRAECGDNFEIAIDDYEAVRAEGRRFVVAPDHQDDDELMIAVEPSYSVIEKVGDPGRDAQTLDPRWTKP